MRQDLIEKIDKTELPQSANNREAAISSKDERFDFAYYNMQEALDVIGINKDMLSGENTPEREFSPEVNGLYDNLKKIIQKEWEKFKDDILKEKASDGKDKETDFNARQVKGYGENETEADVFSSLDIENSGLLTSDALKCFDDEKRTKIFLDTILSKVAPGDKVLEAGSGTGVLAIAAAIKSQSEVTALEINPVTAEFASKVVKRCEELNIIKEGQIKIIKGDALKYNPEEGEEEFDAFISENIYTGQFNELQMQINNALGKYLKNKDKVIPNGMINGFELASLPDDLNKAVGKKSMIVLSDYKDLGAPKKVTDSVPYDHIILSKEEPLGFRNRVVKTVSEDGVINGMTVFSLIQMSSTPGDVIRRNETEFLNDDIYINFESGLEVSQGDVLEIYISYNAGEDPEQADIRVLNRNTGKEVVNKKNFKKHFNAEAYLNNYYPEKLDQDKIADLVIKNIREKLSKNEGRVNIREVMAETNSGWEDVENATIINFQGKVATELLAAFPEDNIKVLDVGGGPTIYQHIPMCLVAGDITHSEFTGQNRDAVQKWLNNDNGRNWDDYFSLNKKLFQDNPEFQKVLTDLLKSDNELISQNAEKINSLISDKEVESYTEHLRSTIKGVVAGDVFKENLGLDDGARQYEAVSASGREAAVEFLTSNFVIESATGDGDKWEEGMKNIMKKVKTGGFLSLTAIRNSSWYQDGVSEEKMPATSVNEEDLTRVLEQNGFKIKSLEVLEGSDKETVGYDGMVFVFAQKI